MPQTNAPDSIPDLDLRIVAAAHLDEPARQRLLAAAEFDRLLQMDLAALFPIPDPTAGAT